MMLMVGLVCDILTVSTLADVVNAELIDCESLASLPGPAQFAIAFSMVTVLQATKN